MNKACILLVLASVTLAVDIKICWRDNYGRGVGTIPKACQDGYEISGDLCYPKCEDGYTGVGPVCWENCPAGWTDTGAFCMQHGKIMAKKSYGRTAGKIPSCDPSLEEQAGLCYTKCNDSYTGDGPMCWADASGNPNYSIQCNGFAYGRTMQDCQQLSSLLKEAGVTSKDCIIALIETIITGRPSGTKKCRQDIQEILPTLKDIHTCSSSPA